MTLWLGSIEFSRDRVMNVGIEGFLKNHPNNWLAWFCLSGKGIYIPFSLIFRVQDDTDAFDDSGIL